MALERQTQHASAIRRWSSKWWALGLSGILALALLGGGLYDALASGTHPLVGLIWSSDVDPTIGPGVSAPEWQLLIRTDNDTIYFKSGTANTAWTELGGGGGGGGTVTSITCGAGLSCTPNPIIATGTIASTFSVTGTNNTVAKFTGASSVGNSAVTDDGTTWGVNSTEFMITEASGNFVAAGTGSIGGALNMNSHLIDNVTNPVSAQDAATKSYVDGSTTGAVSGTTNRMAKFTGTNAVGNSSVTDDATTWAVNSTALSVVEASGNTTIGGTCSIGGALNMNSHLIDNVTDPSAAQDAATKNYVDTSTNTAVNGTANTMAKFTGTHAVGNSSVTDNATTFAINSTEFTVTEASGNVTYLGTLAGGSSGQFTVSAAGLLSAPKVTGSGSSGSSSVVGNFTQTAQTASVGPFSGANTGTYNATAAVRTSFGISVSDTATRSAGANTLTNIGVDTAASGAQVNWAARFNGGDVNVAAGHMIATGTAPSLSSCGSSPAPTITGSDFAATVVTGGTATTCTITFAATYGTAPTCIVEAEGATTHPTYTVSATAITITVDIATTTYDLICVGH